MASFSDSPKSEAVAVAMIEPQEDRFASHQELRIGEIVLAAAALETDDREEFLRQLTVSEPDLLDEARRRLEQATRLPQAFLAVPAAEILDAANQATRAGADMMSTPPLAVGSERYELGECLGRGGMSRVYKAFDRHLQRPVALKLLERADPKTVRRLLREAQTQARVRHEYVLEVYETGDLGGQPFIAMHYVNGPTLMEIREEINLEQKVRLMAQVAEGLDAAHREGLIHRDVKPSNVLVEMTPSGKIKPWVADFGIATALDSGSSIWTTAMAGTPYYIAPERMNDGEKIDRRSDLYSLGVTFYQLLSGELPFDDPSLAEMLRQVREEEPSPLRERAPDLPAELDAIVMKCLAKNPDERYPSAVAVAEELWRFLDGEAVEAHTANLTYRIARAAGRKRFWVAVSTIAVLFLMTLITAFAWSSSTRSRRVADQTAITLDTLDDIATLFREEGRLREAEKLYRQNLDLRREHFGPEHASVARVLGQLAVLLIARGELVTAEKEARQAVEILSRSLPSDALQRARADSILALCWTHLGHYAQAESLLLASYEIFKDRIGEASTECHEALDRLVSLYVAWSRHDKAEEYRALRRRTASS
ncbi:MAG: serine/threonine-protein kinase [Acidobacteriota bacterium]